MNKFINTDTHTKEDLATVFPSDVIELFGKPVSRVKLERLKETLALTVGPSCPMSNWMPALAALPDTTLLDKCAPEWRQFLEAAVEIYCTPNPTQ